MPRKNAIPQERIDFIKAHCATHTASEIARLLDIPRSTVTNTAGKEGIKFTKSTRVKSRKQQMALLLFNAGFSITEIHKLNFSDITYQGLYKYIHNNTEETPLYLH